MLELQHLKKDLKLLQAKISGEFKVDSKLSPQKVTYQSFYYHLKTTAEVLGIKNKDLMNLQSTPLTSKVSLSLT